MKLKDGEYKCDSKDCPALMVHPVRTFRRKSDGKHFCEVHKMESLVGENPEEPPERSGDSLDFGIQRMLEKTLLNAGRGRPKAYCSVPGCGEEAIVFMGRQLERCRSHEHEAFERKKREDLILARAGKVEAEIAEKIGRDYTHCTLENLRATDDSKARIRKAIEASGSIFMSGENGIGKTHTLTAIFRILFESGHSVAVYTAGELLDVLRERTGQDYSSRKVVAEMRAVDWLLIDDLGEERLTDVVLEAFTRVIDWRSRDAKPIVVTTNLTIAQIGEAYSHRIQSRIAGLVGDGLGIKYTGKDARIEKLRSAK